MSRHSGRRFPDGVRVRILRVDSPFSHKWQPGDIGEVINYDGTGIPYRVRRDDGHSGWFRAASLEAILETPLTSFRLATHEEITDNELFATVQGWDTPQEETMPKPKNQTLTTPIGGSLIPGKTYKYGGLEFVFGLQDDVPALVPVPYAPPAPGQKFKDHRSGQDYLIASGNKAVNLTTAEIVDLVDGTLPDTILGLTFQRLS